jgi:hypothetical protein
LAAAQQQPGAERRSAVGDDDRDVEWPHRSGPGSKKPAQGAGFQELPVRTGQRRLRR